MQNQIYVIFGLIRVALSVVLVIVGEKGGVSR